MVNIVVDVSNPIINPKLHKEGEVTCVMVEITVDNALLTLHFENRQQFQAFCGLLNMSAGRESYG